MTEKEQERKKLFLAKGLPVILRDALEERFRAQACIEAEIDPGDVEEAIKPGGICVLIGPPADILPRRRLLRCVTLGEEGEQCDFIYPFRFGALITAIHSAFERLNQLAAVPEIIRLHSASFDPDRDVLSWDDGKEIKLTEKERDILIALYRAGKAGLDRGALLSTVWQYADNVETHTLETHIYRLRQKIEQDSSSPEILMTIENGYRLEGLSEED